MIPEDEIIKTLLKDHDWNLQNDGTFTPMQKELIRDTATVVENRIRSEADKDLLKKFFLWCFRVAKVNVTDPEINIEAKGYSSKDSPSIWDFEKLVSQFLLEKEHG